MNCIAVYNQNPTGLRQPGANAAASANKRNWKSGAITVILKNLFVERSETGITFAGKFI